MQLREFIRKNKTEIADEWIAFIRQDIPATRDLTDEEIQDHIYSMIQEVVDDLRKPQSKEEQYLKSKGRAEPDQSDHQSGKAHGVQRLEIGFSPDELCAEFRSLRASVIRMWEDSLDRALDSDDLQSMIRFNEKVDELLAESVHSFNVKLEESRDWFLGILGHDLRSPLSYISAVLEVLLETDELPSDKKQMLIRMEASTKRMYQLIDNLLEMTRLHLGSGIEPERSPFDLMELTQQIVAEMKVRVPDVNIGVESDGDLTVIWDRLRISQVLTNLLDNAAKYGARQMPITVTVGCNDQDVCLIKVRNQGSAIPHSVQKEMFSRQMVSENQDARSSGSVGLGLYIVSEIVQAHGGSIVVRSEPECGTEFIISIPRSAT